MNIGFIGGGNMARAIISGLKKNNFSMSAITVMELDAEKRAQLTAEFNINTTDQQAGIAPCDVIILAVKPQQLKEVCNQIRPLLSAQLIVSIAAGVRSIELARWLGDYPFIVRVMPNTPAQIQAGISALYATQNVTPNQREQATSILAAVGKTLWLDEEGKMDAVTAISGSGPAYVFFMIVALQEAGVDLGLNTDDARMLALETFAGASLLAIQSADDVKTLRAQVTSKGGTTEQGILALETGNIKSIIARAAQAAAEKSVLLGNQLAQ